MKDSEKTSPPTEASNDDELALPGFGRTVLGGILMGLANLVPGISGGTMLLAAGVYPKFIEAVAEVSTLKFRRKSLLLLGMIVISAIVAIVSFAKPIRDLVIHQRWAMYSLFIGLTLGGVPLIWRMLRPMDTRAMIGFLFGLVVMVSLALLQAGDSCGGEKSEWLLMVIAGAAGASAMILPGVSGAYLLLILGVYDTILSSISALKEALSARDLNAMWDPFLNVVLPVGVGVLLGVVVVSNLLKLVLKKYEKATLGALLGLLIGAIVGLYPFQRGVKPKAGDPICDSVWTPEAIAALKPHKYPTEFFSPSSLEIVLSVVFVTIGLAITLIVARLGQGKNTVST